MIKEKTEILTLCIWNLQILYFLLEELLMNSQNSLQLILCLRGAAITSSNLSYPLSLGEWWRLVIVHALFLTILV